MVICKLVGYSQNVSIDCSVLTLTAISMERFTVVMCPFKRATLNHKARYTVIPIWIISIAMCSPLLYVNQLLEYEGNFFLPRRMDSVVDFRNILPQPELHRHTFCIELCFTSHLHNSSVLLYNGKSWNRQIPGHRHLRHARPYSAARKKLVRMLRVIVCLFGFLITLYFYFCFTARNT